MKKQYITPQVNYFFMDKDIITTSNNLLELDWESNGLDITR